MPGPLPGGLPPDGRDLILKYYVDEGRTRIDNRRRLAQAFGISENALRSRAQRLRDGLECCITDCLGGSALGRVATNDTKS